VRRKVGGYDILEAKADDEKGAGKIVLDTSLLGDNKELSFDDPDNRMHRLKSKRMNLFHEGVPAVIDAELAELAYWFRVHAEDGKLWDGERINPHFEVPTELRAVNLDDALSLIANGSEPSDPSTMEDYTRKRFEKYAGNVGAVEIISTFMGFAVGVGGVAGIQYLKVEVLGDGGGPTTTVPLGMLDVATDVVVTLL
jgi:hypothetical protein